MAYLLPLCVVVTVSLVTVGAPIAARAEEPSRTAVIDLAVGMAHTCTVHADGAVSCWGMNNHGQLGLPATVTATAVPQRVPGIDRAVEVAIVRDRTCVRRADATVACWGVISPNTSLRQPTTLPSTDIAQVAGSCMRTTKGAVVCLTDEGQLVSLDGVRDAVDIAAREDAGCAVHASGAVSCWFAPNDRRRIVGVRGALAIAIADRLACARLRGGEVTCWYWAFESEGLTKTPRPPKPPVQLPVRPRKVPGVAGARLLAGSFGRLCAATARDVRCWSTWTTESQAATVPGLGAVTVLAAGLHNCALRGGRDVVCWGPDSVGQLGNGWSQTRTTPAPVPGITDAVELQAASNSSHTCARRRDNTVTCWGVVAGRDSPTPSALPNAHDIVRLGRASVAMVIDRGGELFATWPGDGHHYELPPLADAAEDCMVARDGRLLCRAQFRPRNGRSDGDAFEVPDVYDAVQVALGTYYACARRRSGTLACLDWNGQAQPAPAIDAVTDLAAGTFAMCAVRADHTVWCWGSSNARVLLGELTPDAQSVARNPAPLPGLPNSTSLTLGYDHACALAVDRTVWCWGDNANGQLGDGTTMPRKVPAPIAGLHNVVQVSAGSEHTCALLDGGTVSCWGNTSDGAVGTYRTREVDTPSAVTW